MRLAPAMLPLYSRPVQAIPTQQPVFASELTPEERLWTALTLLGHGISPRITLQTVKKTLPQVDLKQTVDSQRGLTLGDAAMEVLSAYGDAESVQFLREHGVKAFLKG